ncbi:MAG: metallophosphoesterase [Leptonema sp. (in: bacteria)]
MRTIFIGDVHGCIHELKKMIDTLRPKKEDRVVFLGDLINRGPDPAAVVKFVYENQWDCLMGNHEYEYLKNYKEEKIYQEFYSQIGEELHNWIQNRPYWIEDKNFVAVHAGILPNTPLELTQPEVLVSIRTINDSFLSSDSGIPWFEFYKGEKLILYGHWARKGLTIRNNTIGLDSGCVYGRFLSAYILEERKIIQIPAKMKYYIPPSLRKL